MFRKKISLLLFNLSAKKQNLADKIEHSSKKVLTMC